MSTPAANTSRAAKPHRACTGASTGQRCQVDPSCMRIAPPPEPTGPGEGLPEVVRLDGVQVGPAGILRIEHHGVAVTRGRGVALLMYGLGYGHGIPDIGSAIVEPAELGSRSSRNATFFRSNSI